MGEKEKARRPSYHMSMSSFVCHSILFPLNLAEFAELRLTRGAEGLLQR